MPIYKISNEGISAVPKTNFRESGILERTHLQAYLRDKIEIISADTLIISEEFGGWDVSKKRIDLLGLDKEANLIVIELKRTDSGDHMELQALRYASMISTMSFDKCINIYQEYLDRRNINLDAKESLMNFLEWESPLEEEFAPNVKIVLASADFSKELTTSVLWLISKGIDITCIRIAPYNLNDEILLDVNQIIPLPEAESYLIKIREKENEREIAKAYKRDNTKYVFNDNIYGKGQLVLAIVKQYVYQHKNLSYKEIEDVFPKDLQGSSIGVINTLFEANEKYSDSKTKRYFMNEEDILVSADNISFVVSTQWGIDNINNILEVAKKENYDIQIQ